MDPSQNVHSDLETKMKETEKICHTAYKVHHDARPAYLAARKAHMATYKAFQDVYEAGQDKVGDLVYNAVYEAYLIAQKAHCESYAAYFSTHKATETTNHAAWKAYLATTRPFDEMPKEYQVALVARNTARNLRNDLRLAYEDAFIPDDVQKTKQALEDAEKALTDAYEALANVEKIYGIYFY